MKAKPTGIHGPTRTSLFALALFYSSLCAAQEIDLQTSIDSAAEALIQLDLKASDCLNALNSDIDSKQPCNDFITAIDGELLANYLVQCRQLKDFRGRYVESRVASGDTFHEPDSEEMLRTLVAIEYSCGENAVQARTEFVSTAFERLRSDNASAAGTANNAAVSRRLSESRFNALQASERQRLLDAVQSQQNRSRQESERQFDALENELLRQEIRNRNLPLN